MDTRARDICDRVKEVVGFERIFEVAGNDFLPSYTTPKMLWFKENEPEIFEKTYKFMQSNSYIAMKLTGVMSMDYSQGYGVHFFKMDDCTVDEALAKELGLSADLKSPCSAGYVALAGWNGWRWRYASLVQTGIWRSTFF